jgi:hypothetical protein
MMKPIKVIVPGDNLPRQDLDGEQGKEITAPLYYDDGTVIHVCESSIFDPGIRLVWTKCDRDVPSDASFTVEDGAIEVTCRTCHEAAAEADAALER